MKPLQATSLEGHSGAAPATVSEDTAFDLATVPHARKATAWEGNAGLPPQPFASPETGLVPKVPVARRAPGSMLPLQGAAFPTRPTSIG